MIDKLFLCYRMTRIEYDDAFQKIQNYFKGTRSQLRKDKYDKTAYVTNGLSKYGFRDIRLRKNKWDYRRIEIRLRPKLLIDQEGYYKLTALKEFIEVSRNFNYVLKDLLGLTVPCFFQWQASRVEFAVDLRVKEDLIPTYMILFKKGNVPEYFLNEEITRKYWESETNVYLKSKNKTVNWYNRYETLVLRQSNSNKSFADFSETRGIIRFETQVRNISETVKDILNHENYEKEVLKFYRLIVGAGDYYKMEDAIYLIRQKVSSQGKRMALERLIRLVDTAGSVWRAKELYTEDRNKSKAADQFSKRLNQLRKLNINPVTLPVEWGIDKLTNLYELIMEDIDSNYDEKGEQESC
ncbi:hypothetical protein [Paenibacillus sp. L3-i20]|uniref:hypothetical protein n=1 Tax=Paenibacillus sp. L3-i20 TaxID=2905833 RepID=UPI001EDCB1BF|nr:hypothetical protein [Paenibacillus sp. L3-i20]GKU79433.1 hypothetical protein L3i20_v238300 [Paenibacillus sp. L3-i20]